MGSIFSWNVLKISKKTKPMLIKNSDCHKSIFKLINIVNNNFRIRNCIICVFN